MSYKKEGATLEYLSKNMQDDEDVVLTAVQNSYAAPIKFASLEMKDNKKVGLASVQKNSATLEHLSNSLKDDKEVVWTAVQNDTKMLKSKTSFIGEFLQYLHLAFEFASSRLQSDPQIKSEYEEQQKIVQQLKASLNPSLINLKPNSQDNIFNQAAPKTGYQYTYNPSGYQYTYNPYQTGYQHNYSPKLSWVKKT